MGAWGDESCSNDSCWDALHLCKDIFEITDEEARKQSRHTMLKRTVYSNNPAENAETKVGVIVHLLKEGKTVEVRLLRKALPYIQVMLGDESYLSRWRSPESRRGCLESERKQIEKAIGRGGVGERRHVPGLLERIVTGESK